MPELHPSRRPLSVLVLGFLLVLVCCGGGDDEPAIDREKAWETLGTGGDEAAFDRKLAALADAPLDPPPVVGEDYHPVFPDPIPFDPSEWSTGKSVDIVADPRAVKGGRIVLATDSWPPTIRTEGPASRLGFLSTIHGLVYETLLTWDTSQDAFVPNLATHWQMLDDRMTFRFRIDENARWADGRPVTADDVVATIEDHYKNPDRRDPSVSRFWNERVEYARMLDRLTVEVKSTEPLWRNQISIALCMIYPAAYIRMDGETYIQDWNWRLPPGSGPYELRTEDIRKGRSITLRRRKDWWAREQPDNRHVYNFDEIMWRVVRDDELTYQKFLAGQIDMHQIGIAQRWVEELDREPPVRNGWVQKRRIFNLVPRGFGGYALNARRAPFDRLPVRKAFAHLLNREKLFEKFFFFQYEYVDSYFPGQPYARPDAERTRYDPKRARALLAEAGFVKRDREGYLVDAEGQRFPTLKLDYTGGVTSKRIHDLFRNDLWNEAGIKMELKEIDYASLLKKVWDYRFDIVRWAWTAGLWPSPERNWHGKYADVPQTNNLTGFSDPEADRIMDAYRYEFDPAKRNAMLQRLDRIFFEDHPYALGWYGPYFRLVYWDKFGHPPEYFFRYGRGFDNVLALWWFDPERAARTDENRRAGRKNHPGPLGQSDEIDQKYWLTHERSMPDGR